MLNANDRRAVFAKATRLEAARAALETLTDDECQIMYVEIEGRLASAATATAGTAATSSIRQRGGACGTDQILEILAESKHGLSAHEIGEQIGQPRQIAFDSLTRLKQQGRVERHGSRRDVLWTLPGGDPVRRVETIPAAIVDVLSRAMAPIDSHRLRDEVERVLGCNTHKRPSGASLATALSRLIENGTIAYHGANEHGPLYVLADPN